jgi:drug/metabolite transporter (DMT)-like permease
MTLTQFGELAAIATAILWTFSAIAWTSAGRVVGALPVSFLRLVITIFLLMIYGQIVRGQCLPVDASRQTWAVLGLSGVMGFLVSDLCLFKAYLVIGPRLALLAYSLTPPLTAVISWLFLEEPLDGWQWLAMLVTLAGIVWVVLEEPDGVSPPPRREQLARGILLALGAAAAQAAGTVLARNGVGDCDAGAATFIRVAASVAGYLVLITLAGRWPVIAAAVRRPRAMMIVSAGAVVGPFLGVILFMVALRHCNAGVVSTIIATMPVLILPLAILVYGEKVSFRAAGGAVLSLAGVALLMLA